MGTTGNQTTLTQLPVPTESDLVQIARCDSGVRFRRLIELTVVRRLASDLIAAGYCITVDDGDDKPVKRGVDVEVIMDAVFAVDDCTLYVHKGQDQKPFAWIFLVLGNSGWDVVSDHTTNLDELLQPTSDYADALSEWC